MSKISYLYNEKSTDFCIVEWYPSLICNFNCPYCYAKRIYPAALSSKKENLVLLKKLNAANKPIHIKFMGGEPLLVPGVLVLLKKIKEEFTNIRVTIFTNGSNTKIIDKIEFCERITFVFSFHPYSTQKDVYLKNMESLIARNFEVVSLLMYLPEKADSLGPVITDLKNRSIPYEIIENWDNFGKETEVANMTLMSSCGEKSSECFNKRVDYVISGGKISKNNSSEKSLVEDFNFKEMGTKIRCPRQGCDVCRFNMKELKEYL